MVKLAAIIELFLKTVNNTKTVFMNLYGWLCIGMSSLFAFVKTDWQPFVIIMILIILDLGWGMAASIKNKAFVLSKLMINTIIKIGIYYCTMLAVSLVELMLHDNGMFSLIVITVVAGACELWSMSANMLIINPSMPFLRIFRLQLRGEIESKTNKNLKHILKDTDNTEENNNQN